MDMSRIYHNRSIEYVKISNSAQFSREILENTENIFEVKLALKWYKYNIKIQRSKFVNSKHTKNSQSYVLSILQHFARKLSGFTNFRMLFRAVVISLGFLAFIKLQCDMQIVHSDGNMC